MLADTITGNNSVNVLAGLAGNDTLRGMGGNDVLVGGVGADVLDGGTGVDTADYSTSTAPVHLLLGGVSSGGDAQGDTFISIEKFVGMAERMSSTARPVLPAFPPMAAAAQTR